MTTENAPSSWERASSICPSTDSWRERAMRWTMTSESEVVWKRAPSSTSRFRSSVPLVRFPLWAMARSPLAYRTTMGWAFWIRLPPAVE